MIGDILSTYEALQTVWTKIRAEIISHAVLFVILVKLIGINLPHLVIPAINPQDLLSNPYYQLIKETGLFFLFPLLVLLALAVYLILFRAISRFFSTILITLSPLPQVTPLIFKKISTNELLVFATMSDEDDLSQSDINLAFTKLLTKYRIERKADFDSYLQGVPAYNDSSVSYLGHFAFFLIAWLVIHSISLPGNLGFTISNGVFWKGFFWFSLGLIWSWIRMTNLLEMNITTTIKAVIYFAQTDKELTKKLELVSRENEEKRRKVLARLKELKVEVATENPSLYRYLRYKFNPRKSEIKSRSDKNSKLHKPIRRKYMASNSLYARGHAFRNGKDLSYNFDDDEWLFNYTAYLYYNLYMFLKIRILAFVSLLKFWLFGKT